MTATTCDTGAALLRAVLADPASDTARLIYADWLDEHADDPCPGCDGRGEVRYCDAAGDMDDEPCRECGGGLAGGYRRGSGKTVGRRDRAEFVRVQVELLRVRAWTPGHNGGTSTGMRGVMPVWRERVGELRQRERELWAGQAGARICRDGLRDGLEPRLAPLTDPTPPQCIYRRGFVDEVRLPLAAYLEHARDLFSRHPIMAVVISDREPVELPGRSGAVERGWHWAVGEGRNGIPWDVYDMMPDMPYATRVAAIDTLSVGLVAYGRKLAGLPPIG